MKLAGAGIRAMVWALGPGLVQGLRKDWLLQGLGQVQGGRLGKYQGEMSGKNWQQY